MFGTRLTTILCFYPTPGTALRPANNDTLAAAICDMTDRLDEISTQWSLLRLAHQGPVTEAGPARDALLLRYNQAIRGYVGALVRDEHDADDLAQEALIKLARGDFARAQPERGRFRDLLKVAVKNLVRSYWRGQQRAPTNVDAAEMPDRHEADTIDAAWLSSWRRRLLDLTWHGLEDYQHSVAGNVSYTLLRLRADFPDDDTEALAARLSTTVGRAFRADAVRQQLRRARLRFAQLLAEEVARSLDKPTPDLVEEELNELGLMEYVREFLPPDWRQSGELKDLATY